MVIMVIVSCENLDGFKYDNDCVEEFEQCVFDLDIVVFVFCYVYEYEKLQCCLDEGEVENDLKFC